MKVNCDQGQNMEYIRVYANMNVTTESWNHFYGHFLSLMALGHHSHLV